MIQQTVMIQLILDQFVSQFEIILCRERGETLQNYSIYKKKKVNFFIINIIVSLISVIYLISYINVNY